MDTYSRDTVVIADIKVAWTEGKAIGFIPWSFFVKDESANRKEERTCFYQPFGFAPAPWRSIDEHPYPEATEADLYDARNGFGRWNYLAYMDPESPERRATATLRDRLVAAHLGTPHEEALTPRLQLVPDWRSVITYDEYMNEIEKAKIEVERGELEAKIKKVCPPCAAGAKLYVDGLLFFHRERSAFVRCLAEPEHRRLRSDAQPLFREGLRENYKVLRGHLDSYGRTNSSRRLIRSHSAYRKLVEMGPEMIPFILADLQEGKVGGIWTAEVLSELTGNNKDFGGWLAWAQVMFGVLTFRLIAK